MKQFGFWERINLNNELKKIILYNDKVSVQQLLNIIVSDLKFKNLITDCWEWIGIYDKDGYGKYGGSSAHRNMYQITRLKCDIKNKIVRHTCDNRSCVNPFHLRLGTYQDNSNDMVNRGRSLFGENHPLTTFSDQDIYIILYNLEKGILLKDIANTYKVTETTIYDIAYGKNWNHIYITLTNQQKVQIKINLKNNQIRNKINEQDVNHIRQLWNTGKFTKTELANMFNLKGVTTISNIINKISWKNIG